MSKNVQFQPSAVIAIIIDLFEWFIDRSIAWSPMQCTRVP